MLGAAALSAWMMVSLTRGAAGRGRASDPESKKEAASQRRSRRNMNQQPKPQSWQRICQMMLQSKLHILVDLLIGICLARTV